MQVLILQLSLLPVSSQLLGHNTAGIYAAAANSGVTNQLTCCSHCSSILWERARAFMRSAGRHSREVAAFSLCSGCVLAAGLHVVCLQEAMWLPIAVYQLLCLYQCSC